MSATFSAQSNRSGIATEDSGRAAELLICDHIGERDSACRPGTPVQVLEPLKGYSIEAAAQHGAGADAASSPKIVCILKVGIGTTAFLFYRCGAAQRQAVGRIWLHREQTSPADITSGVTYGPARQS